MRLGEIKKTIGKVLNENNTIILDHKAVYGNQAYEINNYNYLLEALEILSDQSWNDINYSAIEVLKEEYGNEYFKVQIEASEFNGLNSYISNLNSKLPLYFSILETMVEDQDEQMINIKLSDDDITSLEDLSKLNKRLSDIFKMFNIDGGFEFKGFDKGTSWYEIIIIGQQTYTMFIACLGVVGLYLKTREQYFKSKTAELDYKASLKKETDFSEEGLKKYTKKRLELKISEGVKNELEKLNIKNGKDEVELQSQMIMATTELVKELGKHNTEFHLSLNPPEYAEEKSGSLKINYKKFTEIREKNNKTKELGSGENNEDEITEE